MPKLIVYIPLFLAIIISGCSDNEDVKQYLQDANETISKSNFYYARNIAQLGAISSKKTTPRLRNLTNISFLIDTLVEQVLHNKNDVAYSYRFKQKLALYHFDTIRKTQILYKEFMALYERNDKSDLEKLLAQNKLLQIKNIVFETGSVPVWDLLPPISPNKLLFDLDKSNEREYRISLVLMDTTLSPNYYVETKSGKIDVITDANTGAGIFKLNEQAIDDSIIYCSVVINRYYDTLVWDFEKVIK